MRPLYHDDERVARFVADLIPHCHRGFGKCRALGVTTNQGWLVAGIVYHNWDQEAGIIEMSGASITPRWLTRPILNAMHDYPFFPEPVGAGCQMAVMRVPADNERLLRQLAEYGYTFINFPRLFGRHRDGVICHLTDDAWINSKFNKRLKQHLASTSPGAEVAARIKEAA